MWYRQTQPTRYSACTPGLTQSDPQPNNWLINDQFAVAEANRIDVTVEYNIRGCSTFPNNGGNYCDDKFGLYVNQSDQFILEVARYPDPVNNVEAYEKVAEIRQPVNSRTLVTKNSLVKRRHAILAFHNSGACTVLYSVKVTYNVCPDETLSNSLVTLPRTVAPANDSESITVKGSCEKDTVHVQGGLDVNCQSSGEWDTRGLKGRCICKEDMQNVGGKCQGMLHGESDQFLKKMLCSVGGLVEHHIENFVWTRGYCFGLLGGE